jgi:hypothetical protein
MWKVTQPPNSTFYQRHWNCHGTSYTTRRHVLQDSWQSGVSDYLFFLCLDFHASPLKNIYQPFNLLILHIWSLWFVKSRSMESKILPITSFGAWTMSKRFAFPHFFKSNVFYFQTFFIYLLFFIFQDLFCMRLVFVSWLGHQF